VVVVILIDLYRDVIYWDWSWLVAYGLLCWFYVIYFSFGFLMYTDI
jgi:hypothetical protein